MSIWGRLRLPRGLSHSPSKPISSLLTSPYKTFSPLCVHDKLLWQKSFQVRGRWFSLMWSTFQRTQLLTILVNEVVLQFLAAQTPRLHSAPPLGSALSWLKAQPHSFGLAHSLSRQPSNHLRGLLLDTPQGTSRSRFGKGSPGC